MRTHELVLTWIETEIADRRLTVGQRLPPERMLAEQLRVSRTSVREAIRVLEAMGVVHSGVGSGPDSGTVIVAEPSAPLDALLRLHVATSHLPVHDIVQTRVLLESWCVARADPLSPALDEAAELLLAMEGQNVDVESFHKLDAQFHVALAHAAGNILISTMMGSLRESIQRYTLELIHNLPDWSATATRLTSEHSHILNAVRSGDGPKAAELVVEHIEGYYREAGLVSR